VPLPSPEVSSDSPAERPCRTITTSSGPVRACWKSKTYGRRIRYSCE
jgi:hypothetical protein